MLWLVLGIVLLIVAGAGAQVILRMRAMRAAETTGETGIAGDRYRPMLRLLSDADLQFVPAHLRSSVRADRRMIFRRYLKCLAKDYARLLAGIRMAMVRSGVDRPELARALAKNRLLFSLAVCRIEYRLTLHAAGLGYVDVSGLVEALDALRGQVAAFTPSAVGAAA
jgi:hypothetical protein